MTDYESIFAESSDWLEIHSAIGLVGKELRREFEPTVRSYVQNANEELAAQAIKTLGFYWRLPEFEAESERMWRSIENGQKRDAYFLSWGSYAYRSQDRDKARKLLEVIRGEQYGAYMRSIALSQLNRVFEVRQRVPIKLSLSIGKMESPQEVTDAIPWDLVREICEQFRIDTS